MSSSPALSDPADRATQRDEDAQYYCQVLHELVEIGARLARAAKPGAVDRAGDRTRDPRPNPAPPPRTRNGNGPPDP